jgi:hypothetical protein
VISSNWRWRIYEYLDGNESAIGKWLKAEDITQRDRGQLMLKMDMLAMHGTELFTGIVAGPIASKRNPKQLRPSHIYKLKVHGDKQLRPMLCRGPIDMDGEFTFLIGAIEKGGVLDVDALDAEARRQAIIADPHGRRELNGRYKRNIAI